MITVIFEIIFAMFKKLYRFFGPALFVLLVLVIEIIAVPIITDERAHREALHREPFEVLSLKEIAYDEESMDRVFEIKLKNNSSEFKVLGGIAVTDRDGKDIHSSLRSEFEKLKVCGHSAIIDYVPPGSTYTAKLYIDDYKLEGIDSICIYDFYTSETDPKIFEITKK
jgi:hypothetical protein